MKFNPIKGVVEFHLPISLDEPAFETGETQMTFETRRDGEAAMAAHIDLTNFYVECFQRAMTRMPKVSLAEMKALWRLDEPQAGDH